MRRLPAGCQKLCPALLLAGWGLLLVSAGCDTPADVPPTRIDIVSGDNQCGKPGQALPEPLVVRVLGARTRDFLGRKGSRLPAGGVRVTFRVERKVEENGKKAPGPGQQSSGGNEGSGAGKGESRASGPGGAAPPPDGLPQHPVVFGKDAPPDPENPDEFTVLTNTSGLAQAYVKLGSRNGDWRVGALIERPGKKPLDEHFRVVCGVVREGGTEAIVGTKVPLELQLMKRGEDGQMEYLPDRTVFFRLVGEPSGPGEGAEIDNNRDVTGDDGVRDGSDLVLGDRPGVYQVLAEVEPYLGDEPLRGILYRVVAMDWLLVGLRIAGGVLIFLIGVRFLGNGFLLLLSPHLHLLTGPLAQNHLLGFAGGVLSGAAYQSSSTATSYLVSFANGGLLSARGALGLVLGATFGATILPQLLSLHLEFLLVPFLASGLLCFILPRRIGVHPWGWVLLGAGLVLAGWSALESGTELLALSAKFQNDFLPAAVQHGTAFHVLLGSFFVYLAIGLVVGSFLRTSNLLVVLVILFAVKEIIPPATGIPVIIGANLGSALAVLARSWFKLREARRVASLSLLFHLLTSIGVTVLALFPIGGSSLFLWAVEGATPGRLFHPLPESLGHHLAMAHTLYNLFGGVVFLAFPHLLLKLNDRLIPPRAVADDVKPYRLDENLIPVPSLALRQATQEVMYLTELCRKTVAEAFDSFRYADLKLADQVVRREEVISGIHRDLARYLILVAENQLSRRDSSVLEVLQTAAGNLARIGEAGEQLRDLTSRRQEEGVPGNEDADRDLGEVYDLAMAQFENILTLLQRTDARVEESAVKLVERLTKYRSRLEAQWRQRIEQDSATGAGSLAVQIQTLLYQEAFDVLFRVAAHLAHIAQRMRILSPERL